ncbi:C-C chemokine receptor type 4 [Cololabis saira]|uniref:C-C chemokine receptor type 4 n=1 Tax=Cololabis saira TaxID=129043 RepID=UPI002AD36CA8|nr:C-C chemokine receptor type 4 [Cololabis saira]
MTDMHENFTITTMADYSYYYDYNDTFAPCDYVEMISFSKTYLVTLYSFVFILGFLGNGLVVCVLVKHSKKANVTDLCLFNLALSDLLFILTLPFYSHYIMVNHWTFGDFMCRFSSWMHQTGFFSSIFFMVAMTLDRYVVIMYTHRVSQYRRMKGCLGLCLVVWFLSLFVSLPTLCFTKETNETHRLGCSYSPENKNWILYEHFATNVLGLIIPLSVMVFCYSRIIPTLVNLKTIKRHRVIKLIIAIMVIFFLFWAPYNISLFLKFLFSNGTIPSSCDMDTQIKLSVIVTEALAYTHCCLNPIIYAFVGQKFMKRALQIVKSVRFTSYASSRKSSVVSRSSDVTHAAVM